MNGGRGEADGFEIEAPQHDESLAPVDTIVGVVEHIGAKQGPAAVRVATDSEASECDGAVQELHLRAAAGRARHAIRELAAGEIAVPEEGCHDHHDE